MLNTDLYLHFHGQCEEAFKYYKSVFGGEFLIAQRYKDMVGSDKMDVSDSERMMHMSLKITQATTLLGSDLPSAMDENFRQGNNVHFCLQAESEKEANKLFNALSKNGKIGMPMNKTFWGAYFGMCEDQFGVYWMINFTYPKTNQ